MILFSPVLVGLLAFTSAAASAEPPTRALMPEGLHSVVWDSDYPDEAIRKEEEGTVAFRLDVGSDGKPTACAVVESSGSAMLDSTTCRIMMERPRFQPARDANGKPVADQIASRITWRLPTDISPRLETIMALWTNCITGEAAKFVPGDLTASQITERALVQCVGLETLFAEEIEAPVPLTEPRKGIKTMIETMLPQARKALATPPEESSPTTQEPED
jgi:TonB family protein